jgi:hypothetical protein
MQVRIADVDEVGDGISIQANFLVAEVLFSVLANPQLL